MKKFRIGQAISAILCASMLFAAGCGMSGNAVNLMENIEIPETDVSGTPEKLEQLSHDREALAEAGRVAAADFAVRLFNQTHDGEANTLLSPLSVLCALGMTANGAKGVTLAQMEEVFGIDAASLGDYLSAYEKALPSWEECKVHLANSIWITEHERFHPVQAFLERNALTYGAEIFTAPFDASTCRDINSWVSDNTDGMIRDILDEIPEDAVMYLVNALSFDAEWSNIYKKSEVGGGTFTAANGEKQDVKMMYSTESTYLSDENAVGVMKYYANRKYAFAALLPDEGVSVPDYAASLTGEKLLAILDGASHATVDTRIPKFESEYAVEMSDILKAMGMTDAFDGSAADFTGLGTSDRGNIFINRVLHKTYIAVDERGTKAGAATVVEMADECAAEMEEPKRVWLDRPFLYMIIDCESNLPLFMGVVNSVK